MRVTASAPGKLFLTGDWAVLAGAPAIVAAVDRRASVRIDVEAGASALSVTSLAERRTVEVPHHRATLPDGDAGAVGAAWQTLASPGGRVEVDSGTFLLGERKLGLGRSAAVIAAAVAGFLHLRDGAAATQDPAGVAALAIAANHRFQGGRGSGADVAAAVYGGIIEARRTTDMLHVQRRALPKGVHLLAGWTGESAHTPPMLARFDAAAGRDVAELQALVAVAEAAAAAVAADDAAGLCLAVDRSATALARLGERLELPIYTPKLARMVAMARRLGVAAKPSGAGGGDCGIAVTTSAAQLVAVRSAWQEMGIVPLPIDVAPQGVLVAA